MSFSKLSKHQLPNFYNFRNFHPCGKCGSHCDSAETLVLCCNICNKNFHRSCLKLSKKKYREIIQKNETFICSPKCVNSSLPFSSLDDIDFFSVLFGEGKYPCAKCKRDCTKYSACISCSICDRWVHFECSNLSKSEFFSIPYFFCSPACEVCLLPFTEVSTQVLIENDILEKTAASEPKPKPRKKRKKKKANKVFRNERVKFDHFLKINCSYIDPENINDDCWTIL